MDKHIEKTLEYYEKNSKNLFERYEKANLSKIQDYILKLIKKDDFILELGFGSGREINFFINKGFNNIYGIDGCDKFVKKVRKRFNMNNFYFSVLPNIDIPKTLKFDLIYSIALWMHLPTEIYEKSIKNIVSVLNNNGNVFLSYSLEEREEKERYFQKVDEILLNELFNKYGLYKKDEIINIDSLNRNIKWKSVLYGKY